MPKSLDLQVRAQQAAALQGAIGEFVAGLLVNGKPLTIAVSARREFDPDPENERVVLSIYWHEAVMKDLDIRTDVLFLRRCLKCGDYLRGEDHQCLDLSPYPSHQNGEGDGQSSEIKE